MFQPDQYREVLCNALLDLSILAGDITNQYSASWQDVAGTAAANLTVLASMLTEARLGAASHPIHFASPDECISEIVRWP